MRSYWTATGTQTSADSKPRCHVGNSTGERDSDDASKSSMHFDCCSLFSKGNHDSSEAAAAAISVPSHKQRS